MEKLSVFGVTIINTTMDLAKKKIFQILENGNIKYRIFFVNSHTANLANLNISYKNDLNKAELVFGDGVGIRIATRLLTGVQLKDNINGTDLIPEILKEDTAKKYKCFLLGAKESSIEKAANFFKKNFKNWELVGYHHGYIFNDVQLNRTVVSKINQSKADMLLVGMGNPLQEKWITTHYALLNPKLLVGTGGLFTYWSGELTRAPVWFRKNDLEWLHILIKQPKKSKRYILGNLIFITRLLFLKALISRKFFVNNTKQLLDGS